MWGRIGRWLVIVVVFVVVAAAAAAVAVMAFVCWCGGCVLLPTECAQHALVLGFADGESE